MEPCACCCNVLPYLRAVGLWWIIGPHRVENLNVTRYGQTFTAVVTCRCLPYWWAHTCLSATCHFLILPNYHFLMPWKLKSHFYPLFTFILQFLTSTWSTFIYLPSVKCQQSFSLIGIVFEWGLWSYNSIKCFF